MQKKIKEIGLTEYVHVYSGKKKKKVLARIDTGAVISSIDLRLSQELQLGPILETKVIRSANGRALRPVVHCKIQMKNEIHSIGVSLADRGHLNYGLLIGQNYLKKTKFLINPRKKAHKTKK